MHIISRGEVRSGMTERVIELNTLHRDEHGPVSIVGVFRSSIPTIRDAGTVRF
jgi:hypothetical protein